MHLASSLNPPSYKFEVLPVVKKAAFFSQDKKQTNKTKETPVGCVDSDADKAWQNALGKISTATQMKSAAASEGRTASCILLLNCVVDDSVHLRACALCMGCGPLCVKNCEGHARFNRVSP